VISAIAGTAGMGKTSLAVHWAHRVRERFPDGELYVNLRGYDPGPPVTPDQALDGFLRALDVLTADDDETTGVRTVFSWSYHALAPEAARVFRLLGLHPGPDVSVASAAALAGSTVTSVRRQLDALTSAHLLTETRRDRYQFHDLLRAYATKRAALDESPDECANATHRALAWYLHTAHAALYTLYPQHPEIPLDPLTVTCQPLTFTHGDQALQWFDTEHANLMAAIRLAADAGQYTIAWQLPNAMDAFWDLRYHWADRITVHQLGLAAAVHIHDQLGERWTLTHLGETYSWLGRFEETFPLALRGLVIAQETGDGRAEGNSMNSLGYANLHLRRPDEANDYFQRALTCYREVNHRRNEALALVNLADVARGQQHFEQAVTYAQNGLAIYRETNDRCQEGWTLEVLGLIYLDLRRFNEAANHFRQTLAICRELSDRHKVAKTLHYLGEALRAMDRLSEARESWLEALSIFDDLGAPETAQLRACLETLDAHNSDQHR
jgi:tetratricopeptide (TPR) repeat protein